MDEVVPTTRAAGAVVAARQREDSRAAPGNAGFTLRAIPPAPWLSTDPARNRPIAGACVAVGGEFWCSIGQLHST